MSLSRIKIVAVVKQLLLAIYNFYYSVIIRLIFHWCTSLVVTMCCYWLPFGVWTFLLIAMSGYLLSIDVAGFYNQV